MGFTTTCILFSGLCLAMVRAECGDDCKAKGGKCSWERLDPLLWKYQGACREGKWGQDQVCYCGYCYTKHKPCDQHPGCRGKCQRNPPGKDWKVTGDCYKGCKCWEKRQYTCHQDEDCIANGGYCSVKPINTDDQISRGKCFRQNGPVKCLCYKR